MPSPVLPPTASLVLRLPFAHRHFQPLLSAPLLNSILRSSTPPLPPDALPVTLFSHSVTLDVVHLHPSPSQVSSSTDVYLLPPLPPSLVNPPPHDPLPLLSLPLNPPPLLSSLSLPPPTLFLSTPGMNAVIARTALHHNATLLYIPASYLLRNSSLNIPLVSLLHIAKLTQPSVLLFDDAQLLLPPADSPAAAVFISNFLPLPSSSRIAIVLSQSHPDHPLHPYVSTSIQHKLHPHRSTSSLSSTTDISPDVLSARWDRLMPSLGGLHHAKRILQRLLLWPRVKPSTLSRLGLHPPHAILLYGVPGTGKTMILSLAAEAAVYHVERVDAALLARGEVGMSEKILRDAFARAEEKGYAVLLVDEIDALFVGGERPHLVRLASVLGVLMDQLGGGRVVVVAATNRPWRVSRRLMRAGRFESCVKVGVPGRKERREIGGVYARKMEVEEEVARGLEALAEEKEGWTGADIAGACRRAVMRAASGGRGQVGMEDLVWAFGEVVGSIREEEVRRVEEWLPGR